MPKKPFRIVPHKLKGVSSAPLPEQPSPPKHEPVQQPLLFINRDKENLHATRSAAELQAITSHVARQSRKPRKGENRSQLYPSPSRTPITENDQLQDTKSPNDAVFENATCPHGKVMHTIPGFFSTVNCYFCALSLESNTPIVSRASRAFLGTHSPQLESAGSSDSTKLISLYFKVILPWAKALQHSWRWIENVSQLEASPMLYHAVAAYTSAFFSGLQLGARGIVLPPIGDKGIEKESLWPVPPWLKYQTQAVNLLRSTIVENHQQERETTFLTVLLLLRLAVMLGDGVSAKFHLDALEKITESQKDLAWSKEVESSMVKVNIISSYFHSPALIFRDREDQEKKIKYRTVDHNPELWEDDSEWHKCQNMIIARLLTWRQETPTAYLDNQVGERMLQMDQNVTILPRDGFQLLEECYQLALYLMAWLIGISFDTHNPKICMYIQELVDRLHRLDFDMLWQNAPNVLFNILFAGAFASRGFLPRVWFIEQIAKGKVRVRYMHELYAMLSKFTDPGHIRTILLEELLAEILHATDAWNSQLLKPSELYVTRERGRPPRGQRPFTYSPELSQIMVQRPVLSHEPEKTACQA